MAFKRGYDRCDGESSQQPAFVPKIKILWATTCFFLLTLMASWRGLYARGSTSMGTYLKDDPNWDEFFLSSAITTNWSENWATIFSWARHPPPPLIRVRWLSASSAPSMATLQRGWISREERFSPFSVISCLACNKRWEEKTWENSIEKMQPCQLCCVPKTFGKQCSHKFFLQYIQ